MRTLIIGCGAAGAAAAIAAARRGDHVTVLERNRKPLKKLCVTGNGRGNLLNVCDPSDYGARYFGDSAFAERALAAMPCAAVRAFWEEAGVPLLTEGEGRVYPAACLASVAAEALLHAMNALGVTVITGARVSALCAARGEFSAKADVSAFVDDAPPKSGKIKKGEAPRQSERVFTADRVIVAAGGQAAPAHGTDGSAYALLQAFRHTLTPLKPALCALTTEPTPIRGLGGQRARAALTLLHPNGAPFRFSAGEILFAEDGVSGIAAMQLARFVEDGCVLLLNLSAAVFGDQAREPCPGAVRGLAPSAAFPTADASPLLEARIRLRGREPLKDLFTGAATPALRDALFRAAGVTGLTRPAQSLSRREREALARAIDAFALRVTGTRGFAAAQVTAGGIDASAFDPDTMQSRLVPGLYAAGEMLNVDGDCGGFNLLFAVASGLIAGRG